MFHNKKYKAIHLSAKNMHTTYIIHLGSLGWLHNRKKDLGDHRLSNRLQYQSVANKVGKIFFCIKNYIHAIDKYIVLPLYKTLNWIEYVVQFWSSIHRNNVFEVERVQKKKAKSLRGFEDLSYKKQLQKWHLLTLAKRCYCDYNV